MSIKIAIDGPSGAGKSSLAKAISKQLGFIYIDTGALYRSIGYYSLKKGVDTKNEAEISKVLDEIKVELKHIDTVQRVFVNSQDVSDYIRTPEVSMAASDVSAMPCVREFLLSLQREIANENNCIMDGRDIGTVVLPDANLKIFLTASAEARAQRRYIELKNAGIKDSYEQVLNDIIVRDNQDSSRDIAPLKPAKDSILFDSSDNTFEQSYTQLIALIKENL